jgi:N-carbamoylputrescine amidase
MRVGIIQQANTTDREENVKRLQQKIRQLAQDGQS